MLWFIEAELIHGWLWLTWRPGEWSPKSQPLFTWRKAPKALTVFSVACGLGLDMFWLHRCHSMVRKPRFSSREVAPPKLLFPSHGSLVFGLASLSCRSSSKLRPLHCLWTIWGLKPLRNQAKGKMRRSNTLNCSCLALYNVVHVLSCFTLFYFTSNRRVVEWPKPPAVMLIQMIQGCNLLIEQKIKP